MKKFFIALCMSLIFLGSYAQTTSDNTLKTVTNGVSAIHTDTKDAISTLHQDAAKIVETAYTDSKSVLGIIYDDANKIIQYAAPKLEAGLVTLAKTLKTTVAEVYEAAIRKQIAVSISILCYGLLGLLFLYFSYRIAKMPEDKLTTIGSWGTRVWKAEWIIGFTFTSIMTLTLMSLFFFNFKEMVIGFYAPKYGAIQEIVTIVDTLLK